MTLDPLSHPFHDSSVDAPATERKTVWLPFDKYGILDRNSMEFTRIDLILTPEGSKQDDRAGRIEELKHILQERGEYIPYQTILWLKARIARLEELAK